MSLAMQRQKSVAVTANVNVPIDAETVVATLGAINPPGANVAVKLHGWVQVATAALHTSMTVAVRRGTTAGGTLVGEATLEQLFSAAGGTEERSIDVTDTPGEGSFSYVLTVTVTGGAAAATALQSGLEARTP